MKKIFIMGIMIFIFALTAYANGIPNVYGVNFGATKDEVKSVMK